MTTLDILGAVNRICSRGGEVCVSAIDPLNPSAGYQARVALATPWKKGEERFSADSRESAADALILALTKSKV
jgi:hypothetical protein